ncbi:3-dehydroquinate synthase [Neobacillus sp. SM06]|uniref:3-dehydroquinate synthase n=1 Tax=Neobacillus sp. SM06 TaxID=3422492 RepID=UPI003D26629C
MDTVQIQTDSKSYDVYIGEGALDRILPFLKKHFPRLTKLLIITDETVAALHLETLQEALQGSKSSVFIAPSGEKAKTFDMFYQALTTALENRLDRYSAILSFGGGAVGDLSGFVASSFMRGIPFIQIPTTILAHDSAVGGKVAINHPLGKNMIGAFYQPEAVFYDLKLIKTLPQAEIRSGFAEVIKHALIRDPDFYQSLVNDIQNLGSLSTEQLRKALVRGVEIKREFVSRDERETGVRAYLNFGHTLGHAIEAEMGYGNSTHGEAVMIGMIFALSLSRELFDLTFDLQQFRKWVRSLGYETNIPPHLLDDRLVQRMKQDKKAIGESIHFVLLERPGSPILQTISDELVLEQLKRFKLQKED